MFGIINNGESNMKDFFGEDYLLANESAKKIYSAIKDLPIIDYHCHLDDKAIKNDKTFSDIGELWLSDDKASGFVTGTAIPVDGSISALVQR